MYFMGPIIGEEVSITHMNVSNYRPPVYSYKLYHQFTIQYLCIAIILLLFQKFK